MRSIHPSIHPGGAADRGSAACLAGYDGGQQKHGNQVKHQKTNVQIKPERTRKRGMKTDDRKPIHSDIPAPTVGGVRMDLSV